MKCLLCDSRSVKRRSGKVRDNESIKILECNNCGFVFLDDQKQGQVWKQGNNFLTWKKGDCFTWPWRDIPHGTANFGHDPRPTLNITGEVTEETYKFLKTCPRRINV